VRHGVGVPDHHILGVKARVAAVAGAWEVVIHLLDVDGGSCLSRKAIRLEATTPWVPALNEPMAARVATQSAIERCCWSRVFAQCWSSHPPASQLVAPAIPRRSRVSVRPSPTIPIPRMRCRKSSAVFTGTKLAADSWPTMSPYTNSTR
jgi:hypothetical protein